MATTGSLVAFVTGATGVQGRALIRRLEADDQWAEIVATSRSLLDMEIDRTHHIRMDLMDTEAVKSTVADAKLAQVTHVFHLAFSGHKGRAGDMTNRNTSVARMLENVVEGLEAAGAKLQHVYFTNGTKQYGVHWGETKTPFREDDPRHMPPNYYYDNEDYVISRVGKGASWTWSSFRPGPVIGFSTSYMSLLNCVAVYATLSKELGLPLRFPGSVAAFCLHVYDCVDVDLLSDAQIWAATHEEAANTAFNIHNGDVFRWAEVWPAIAAWFHMPMGPPLRMPLTMMMTTPEKSALWEKVVRKHGLVEFPYEKMAQWAFADATLDMGYDAFSVTTLLRKRGYHGQNLDTPEMWRNKLDQLAADRIIPNYCKH